MNAFRAVVLVALGIFALYRGWVVHTGGKAWFAYILGVLAIALGLWRLLRNPNKPLL